MASASLICSGTLLNIIIAAAWAGLLQHSCPLIGIHEPLRPEPVVTLSPPPTEGLTFLLMIECRFQSILT